MNHQMFVETLIITSSFFAIAAVLVLSVLLIERTG
ncbi:TPA: small membrane protein YoaI [Escherichia coli]